SRSGASVHFMASFWNVPTQLPVPSDLLERELDGGHLGARIIAERRTTLTDFIEKRGRSETCPPRSPAVSAPFQSYRFTLWWPSSSVAPLAGRPEPSDGARASNNG